MVAPCIRQCYWQQCEKQPDGGRALRQQEKGHARSRQFWPSPQPHPELGGAAVAPKDHISLKRPHAGSRNLNGQHNPHTTVAGYVTAAYSQQAAAAADTNLPGLKMYVYTLIKVSESTAVFHRRCSAVGAS